MKTVMMIKVFLMLGILTVTAQKSAIFIAPEGAIHGYDAVAYFEDAKALKGDKLYAFSWKGADWYFASQQHLDSFKTNPEKYAPQFGGYCAFGMSAGHKAPTDPEAWTIVDDKLYFNYNKDVQAMWKKDTETSIKKANTNWETLKDKE